MWAIMDMMRSFLRETSVPFIRAPVHIGTVMWKVWCALERPHVRCNFGWDVPVWLRHIRRHVAS